MELYLNVVSLVYENDSIVFVYTHMNYLAHPGFQKQDGDGCNNVNANRLR
jgi:hypothetical protein